MHKTFRTTLVAASVLALGACGGGGGDDDPATPPEPTPPTTTAVTVTVMDGLLRNAKVCVDVNEDGRCGDDEFVQRTGADGQAVIEVPNELVGQRTLLAEVGTDAVDADSGAVTPAYTLSAPGDGTGIVSPWSTLVELVRRRDALTTDQAAALVQSQTGLSISPLSNYSGATAGSEAATLAVAARVLVASVQSQLDALSALENTSDAAGSTMTAQSIQRAVQNAQIEALPSVMAAAAEAAVACGTLSAGTCAQAVDAALTNVPAVSADALPNQAAALRLAQEAASNGSAGAAPMAGYNLDWLSFTDSANWYYRALITSTAGAVPDAQGLTRYRDERKFSADGAVTPYAWVGSAARQGDTHWSGTAWVSCGVDEEAGTSTARNAQGVSVSDFCKGRNVSQGTRVAESVAGQSMAAVIERIRVGRPNAATWGPEPAVLGSTTFPDGAALLHQWFTDLSSAITYDVRESNQVGVYSAEVSAGGDTRTTSGLACEDSANWVTQPTDSLEQMISRFRGTPCLFNQVSNVFNGNTLYSADPQIWANQSTVSIGVVGSQPLDMQPRTAWYTDNRWIRAAFTGDGQATYYSCLQRWNNGTPFNCETIGTGTYAVSMLGDARILRFANLPAQAGPLSYERVFVERAGRVYYGYENKLRSTYSLRLNGVAASALLSTLGMPAVVVP